MKKNKPFQYGTGLTTDFSDLGFTESIKPA